MPQDTQMAERGKHKNQERETHRFYDKVLYCVAERKHRA